jgi:hypothetical protein
MTTTTTQLECDTKDIKIIINENGLFASFVAVFTFDMNQGCGREIIYMIKSTKLLLKDLSKFELSQIPECSALLRYCHIA